MKLAVRDLTKVRLNPFTGATLFLGNNTTANTYQLVQYLGSLSNSARYGMAAFEELLLKRSC
jgi:hypothetical protein